MRGEETKEERNLHPYVFVKIEKLFAVQRKKEEQT